MFSGQTTECLAQQDRIFFSLDLQNGEDESSYPCEELCQYADLITRLQWDVEVSACGVRGTVTKKHLQNLGCIEMIK